MNASAGVFDYYPMNERADEGKQRLDDGAIEKQLDRIIHSEVFKRASRLRSLLEYVVHLALRGQANTEARTARELLGRNEDFDPSLDPVIRVNFGRLRRALTEYYATEGNRDEVVIKIPNRKYTPVFGRPESTDMESSAPEGSLQDPPNGYAQNGLVQDEELHEGPVAVPTAQVAATTPVPAPSRVAIAVLPFANLTNDSEQDSFCYGLTAEISNALAVLPEIDVVANSSSFQYKDEHVDVRAVGRELGVPYVLEGSVRIEDGQARVVAQLARTEDGVAIWSNSFDGKMNGHLNTQRAITDEVVRNLPLDSVAE